MENKEQEVKPCNCDCHNWISIEDDQNKAIVTELMKTHNVKSQFYLVKNGKDYWDIKITPKQ